MPIPQLQYFYNKISLLIRINIFIFVRCNFYCCTKIVIGIMKKKCVNIFFVFVLCVLAFLHFGFTEPEKESNMQLHDVEVLSTSEGSFGDCNISGGWCFINGPKKGIHIL